MKLLIEKFVKHSDIEHNPNFVDQLRTEMSDNLSQAVEKKIDWQAIDIDTTQSKYTASVHVMNNVEWKTAKKILLAVTETYPDSAEDIKRAMNIIDPLGQF